MSDYQAPLRDIQYVLESLRALEQLRALPPFEDLTDDVAQAVLSEAARFAEEMLAPLHAVADRQGTALVAGQVRVPEAMRAAYARFVEGGWPALAGPQEAGGQGLPRVLATPAAEMWRAANLAFALCPMLTENTAMALLLHGSESLRAIYLPKLVSGEWTGAMNLTEPQAGSDLAATQTMARPEGDHYRISGRKIFITWGDHDLADNIVHFVLARTPDAPPGVKGISLFLVPKYLVNADGSLGERNDLVTVSVEEKLGIHGSPTCVLSYGEEGGAVGYLVGELHQGLSCMFTVMNLARLAVGVEALAQADRSYQKARAFARERVQGREPGSDARVPIVRHPDVRRMLLVMRASTEAMRALAYTAALELDLSEHALEEDRRAEAAARVALLTPIVKGWCSELSQEVVSLGLQVHGGAGYIEETGAAQLLRDARITSIYEGTTGIQANDLVNRKLVGDDGRALAALVGELRSVVASCRSSEPLPEAVPDALGRGLDAVERAADFILRRHRNDSSLPGAAAVNFLLLMGTVLGGWQSSAAASAAAGRVAEACGEERAFLQAKIVTATFYAQHMMPRSEAYVAAVLAGSESIMALEDGQL